MKRQPRKRGTNRADSTALIVNIIVAASAIAAHVILFSCVQLLAGIIPLVVGVALTVFALTNFGEHSEWWGFALVACFVSLGTLVSTLKILVRAFYAPSVGARVNLKILDELAMNTAKSVKVASFDEVRVVPGAVVATAHVGDLRVLMVGLLAMKYLSSNELAALFAHEYGHYHFGAMMPHRVHYRAQMVMIEFKAALRRRRESITFSLAGVAGFVVVYSQYWRSGCMNLVFGSSALF
jgi:hypothetical protein